MSVSRGVFELSGRVAMRRNITKEIWITNRKAMWRNQLRTSLDGLSTRCINEIRKPSYIVW